MEYERIWHSSIIMGHNEHEQEMWGVFRHRVWQRINRHNALIRGQRASALWVKMCIEQKVCCVDLI